MGSHIYTCIFVARCSLLAARCSCPFIVHRYACRFAESQVWLWRPTILAVQCIRQPTTIKYHAHVKRVLIHKHRAFVYAQYNLFVLLACYTSIYGPLLRRLRVFFGVIKINITHIRVNAFETCSLSVCLFVVVTLRCYIGRQTQKSKR